jgi:hypothetical protein
MNRFLIFAGILMLLLLVFNSCLNDEDYIDRRAYGDALIRAYQQGDSVVYNVQLFVYSSVPMHEVTAFAKNNSDSIIQLDSLQYRYTFMNTPSRESYLSEVPSADRYSFDVSFGAEDMLRVSDFLDTSVVSPPVIDTLKWNEDSSQIEIEWKNSTKTHYYKLFLINDKNEVLFESELLEKSQTRHHINQYTYGWQTGKIPTENTVLKVQVNAYLFEPMATTFDIQCIATNDQHSVDWKINK